MAPLFFTLLAEESLAWHRLKLSSFEALCSGSGDPDIYKSHPEVKSYAERERESIEKADVFGKLHFRSDLGDNLIIGEDDRFLMFLASAFELKEKWF